MGGGRAAGEKQGEKGRLEMEKEREEEKKWGRRGCDLGVRGVFFEQRALVGVGGCVRVSVCMGSVGRTADEQRGRVIVASIDPRRGCLPVLSFACVPIGCGPLTGQSAARESVGSAERKREREGEGG